MKTFWLIENLKSEYLVCAILVIDYLLGVTNAVKANSLVECVLRSIGHVIVSLLPKKKMMKKKGLRK